MDDHTGSESQTIAEPASVLESKEPSADAAAAATEAAENTPGAGELAPSSALRVTPDKIAPGIEALLLSVDKPISGARLAEALGLVHDAEDAEEAGESKPTEGKKKPKGEGIASRAGGGSKKGGAPDTPLGIVRAAVELLNAHYTETKRAFRIETIAGGYRLMTLPKFAPVLEAYHGKRERHGVSRAALETLSIIAYKQPITRAGLENIRGVACGEVLRSLIERRLVTIVGRAEELGRPMLYGTTRAFLETFGLSSVKDLPSVEDFKTRGSDDE